MWVSFSAGARDVRGRPLWFPARRARRRPGLRPLPRAERCTERRRSCWRPVGFPAGRRSWPGCAGPFGGTGLEVAVASVELGAARLGEATLLVAVARELALPLPPLAHQALPLVRPDPGRGCGFVLA